MVDNCDPKVIACIETINGAAHTMKIWRDRDCRYINIKTKKQKKSGRRNGYNNQKEDKENLFRTNFVFHIFIPQSQCNNIICDKLPQNFEIYLKNIARKCISLFNINKMFIDYNAQILNTQLNFCII